MYQVITFNPFAFSSSYNINSGTKLLEYFRDLEARGTVIGGNVLSW